MQKGKNRHKIPKSFFVALIVALFFWLLTKLSKEYQAVVSFPVEYVNIPQDKLIQSTPLNKIDVQGRASGFRFLNMSLFKKKITLDVRKSQRKLNSEYYILIENQKIDIQNQVANNFIINGIAQDTIYLDLGQLTSKKIPLKGIFDFSYKSGYHLTKSIKITPDSILVSGPKSQIDTLQNFHLQKLTLQDISKTVKQTIKINSFSDLIKFSTKEATVLAEVDRFTEGNLELPFEIINLPDSVSVTTFPKSVQIFYQVGLANFSKVNATSFKIVCDYNNSLNNHLNYLIPRVVVKPDFVTSVKINPNKIEYLIQK
ncbi:YbbR-like domain-containing protein [Polaribacter uvawellassae]|uniref:YbbR-like domain-containing protein n=1 Tax=Polaribacter uvawellassae TaxID=3133495 RepID=UPI003219E65B